MDGDEVKEAARVRLEVEVPGGACVVVCRGPVCAPQDRACVTRKAVSHGSSLPTAAELRTIRLVCHVSIAVTSIAPNESG